MGKKNNNLTVSMLRRLRIDTAKPENLEKMSKSEKAFREVLSETDISKRPISERRIITASDVNSRPKSADHYLTVARIMRDITPYKANSHDWYLLGLIHHLWLLVPGESVIQKRGTFIDMLREAGYSKTITLELMAYEMKADTSVWSAETSALKYISSHVDDYGYVMSDSSLYNKRLEEKITSDIADVMVRKRIKSIDIDSTLKNYELKNCIESGVVMGV